MEKTFTLQQVKKLMITTAGITALIVWGVIGYIVPKIEEHSLEVRMDSHTKAIIGDEQVH